MQVWRRNSKNEDLPELRAPTMRMLETSQSELLSTKFRAEVAGIHKTPTSAGARLQQWPGKKCHY